MSQPGNFTERSQQLMLDIQYEFEKILMNLKTMETEIDSKLLEQVFTHHMRRSQESITVLCKLLDDYQRGALNSASLLALALQT